MAISELTEAVGQRVSEARHAAGYPSAKELARALGGILTLNQIKDIECGRSRCKKNKRVIAEFIGIAPAEFDENPASWNFKRILELRGAIRLRARRAVGGDPLQGNSPSNPPSAPREISATVADPEVRAAECMQAITSALTDQPFTWYLPTDVGCKLHDRLIGPLVALTNLEHQYPGLLKPATACEYAALQLRLSWTRGDVLSLGKVPQEIYDRASPFGYDPNSPEHALVEHFFAHNSTKRGVREVAGWMLRSAPHPSGSDNDYDFEKHGRAFEPLRRHMGNRVAKDDIMQEIENAYLYQSVTGAVMRVFHPHHAPLQSTDHVYSHAREILLSFEPYSLRDRYRLDLAFHAIRTPEHVPSLLESFQDGFDNSSDLVDVDFAALNRMQQHAYGLRQPGVATDFDQLFALPPQQLTYRLTRDKGGILPQSKKILIKESEHRGREAYGATLQALAQPWDDF